MNLCKIIRCLPVANSGGHGFHTSAVMGFGTSPVHQVPAPVVSRNKKLLLMTPEQLSRRKKKLEKELRRLSKQTIRDLRPIAEYETIPQLKRDIMSGRRDRAIDPLTPEQQEQEILLEKEWCRHKMAEHIEDCRTFNRLVRTQALALEKLREESEELYVQAKQLDPELLEYSVDGPLNTMPIKGHLAQDGKYIDHTDYFDDLEKYEEFTQNILERKKR